MSHSGASHARAYTMFGRRAHTCMSHESHVVCWGDNSAGQLGTAPSRFEPGAGACEQSSSRTPSGNKGARRIVASAGDALWLDNNRLTSLPLALAAHPRLRNIVLFSNPIAPAELKRLRAAMPQITIDA